MRSSHCSVGWSGIHIVHLGDLELKFFSGIIWGVHIVQKGEMEFTLFTGVVWSLRCCVKEVGGMEWRQIVKSVEDSWSGQMSRCCVGKEWRQIVKSVEDSWSGQMSKRCVGKEWRQMVKSVEDSWSGWVWGPHVIYWLAIRSWAWNLKEKYIKQIALVFNEI